MSTVKLSHNVKKFIVIQLAHFESVRQVTWLLKDEFDLTVPEHQVSSYIPKNNPKLAKQWVDLFESEREKAKSSNAEYVPMANKFYRLKQIDKLLNKNMNNAVLVMQLLRIAAMETGNAYNKPIRTTGNSGRKRK